MSATNETSPHRARSESQDLAVCGIKGSIPWAICQLPKGHPFPHRHEDEQGVTTWEPVDVSDLRQERDELRAELQDKRLEIGEIVMCEGCSKTEGREHADEHWTFGGDDGVWLCIECVEDVETSDPEVVAALDGSDR